uniref:Flagellar hook-length control protein FliK n=1 Tax=Desulfatirhabdium butyrativorans TaxID=340467 RepID=A0A7C4RTE8_9BACT
MTQTNMPGLMLFGSGTGPKDRLQTSGVLLSGTVCQQEAQHWILALSQALQPAAHPIQSETPLQQKTVSAGVKEDTTNTTTPKRVRRNDESLIHVLGGLALQPSAPQELGLQSQVQLNDDPMSLPDGSTQEDVLPKEGGGKGALSPRMQNTEAGSKRMAAGPEAIPAPKVAEIRLREGEVKTTEDNDVSMQIQNSEVMGHEKNGMPPDLGAQKPLRHAPLKQSSEGIGNVQVLNSTQEEGSTSERDVSYGLSEVLSSQNEIMDMLHANTFQKVGSSKAEEPQEGAAQVTPKEGQSSRLSTGKASTQNGTIDTAISMLQGEASEKNLLVGGLQGRPVQRTEGREATGEMSFADSAKAGTPRGWFKKSIFGVNESAEFESHSSNPVETGLLNREKSTVGRTLSSFDKRLPVMEEGGRNSIDTPENSSKTLTASAGKGVNEVHPQVDVEDIRLSTARVSAQNNSFDASVIELQEESSEMHLLVGGFQGRRVQATDRKQTSFSDPLYADSPNALLEKENFELDSSVELKDQSSVFGRMEMSDEDATSVGRPILSLEERNSKKDDNFFGLAGIREDPSKPSTASGGKPVDAASRPIEVEGIHATIRNAVLHHPEGTSEMRLVLKPEWLGSMTMRIQIDEGKVQVHIATEHQESRDLIKSQVPLLRSELASKGLVVETIRVEVSGERTESHSGAAMGQWASHQEGRESGKTFEWKSHDLPKTERQEASYSPVVMETIPKGRLSAFA